MSEFNELLKHQGYPTYNPKVSYKKLIEDPTAINLDTGPRVTAVIRNLVEDYLKTRVNTFVKNKELREAIRISSTRDKAVVEFLMSWTTLLPKVAADIYSASLAGQVEAVLEHFTGTRTIIALSWGENREGFAAKIRRTDKMLLEKFLLMHANRKCEGLWNCSYQHAIKLREESWRKSPIRGVTVPHPFEQFYVQGAPTGKCYLDDLDPPLDDYILIILDENFVCRRRSISSAGPMKPYVGSLTSEKRLTVTACEATSDEPLLRRVMRILNEVNWFTRENGKLGQSLLHLFTSLTDYPLTYEPLHAVQIFWDADHR